MLKFNHSSNNIIKVIGVGGGGNNAVDNMFQEGIKDVDFIIANTDEQALKNSPVPKKIALGKTGRGAGNKPSIGREAALESIDEIREVLEKNTQMLFITAGMGGGTGTGAAPVIASVSKELGILTIAIVTIPFSFEGKRRKLQAQQGIEELRKNVDTILIIVNDKLRDIHPEMMLKEAFAKADNILTTASKGIAELITVTGIINVDFEDVKTVMENGGKSIMSTATAEGEDRAIKCSEAVLSSPLLADSNIKGAANILLYISSGTEEMSLNEVTDIAEYITDKAGDDSDVIWGTGIDETLGKNIKITLVATGFEKQQETKKEDTKVIHNLYKKSNNETTNNSFSFDTPIQQNKTPNLPETPNQNNESTSLVDLDIQEPTKKVVYDFETGEKIETESQTPENIEFEYPQQPVIKEENTLPEIESTSQEEDLSFNKINNHDDIIETPTNVKPTTTPSKINSDNNFTQDDEPIHEEINNINNDLPKEEQPFTFTKKKVKKINNIYPNNRDSVYDKSQINASERVKQLRHYSATPLTKKQQEKMHSESAYKRKGIILDNTPTSDEEHNTDYQVSVNKNNETIIKKNNSYIHKNID